MAADLIDDYPGGTWFVELEEATDELAVVAVIAGALACERPPVSHFAKHYWNS